MVCEASVLKYLWQIWWKIPGSWKQKKRILSCAAVPVRDYAERNPHAGYVGLIHRFGTPEQIVESYLDDMDVKELSEQLNVRKKIVAIAGAAAIVMVVIWIGVVVIATINHYNQMNGHFEEYVTVDDYSVNDDGGT